MNKPLLSICIPTYNRSGYLEKALESIRVQIADNASLHEMVEVVVSDNASTDNTREIAERYKKYFAHFTYAASEKNVGFDLNIVNVVKNASGAYCWYLGDDDVIANGAIAFVSDQLKNNSYDVATIGSEQMPEDESYKTKRNFSESEIEEVAGYNDFYFKNYCEGTVSVLIFNRELWLSSLDLGDYMEHWLYYEVVLKMLVRTKKKMLRLKQTLAYLGQDCRWAENGGELFTFTNSNILMERMIGFGFDKARLLKALDKNSKKIVIIVLRAKGHDLACNMKNLKFIYTNLKRAGFLRLSLVTIVYFIPNPLIKLARDARKIF